MPAEAKSPTAAAAPLSDANAQTPKKKQNAGKAAVAKVTLLDGSTLDVTIDVRTNRNFIAFSLSIDLHEFGVFFLFYSARRKAKIY